MTPLPKLRDLIDDAPVAADLMAADRDRFAANMMSEAQQIATLALDVDIELAACLGHGGSALALAHRAGALAEEARAAADRLMGRFEALAG